MVENVGTQGFTRTYEAAPDQENSLELVVVGDHIPNAAFETDQCSELLSTLKLMYTANLATSDAGLQTHKN